MILDLEKQKVYHSDLRFVWPGKRAFCSTSDIKKVYLNSEIKSEGSNETHRTFFQYGVGLLTGKGRFLEFLPSGTSFLNDATYESAVSDGEQLAQQLGVEWVPAQSGHLVSIVGRGQDAQIVSEAVNLYSLGRTVKELGTLFFNVFSLLILIPFTIEVGQRAAAQIFACLRAMGLL